MTPDSEDQWVQAYNFRFNNHHPFFHTFILALLQRVIYSPAFVAFLQIVATSFMLAFFLNYLYKKGVRLTIVTALFLLLAFSPSIGYFNITLWKDIPFSLGVVAIGLIFFVHSIDGFPKRKKWLFIFGVFFALIGSLRHNGLLL